MGQCSDHTRDQRFLLKHLDQLSGPPSRYPKFLLRDKTVVAREIDTALPSSIYMKNEWNCISILHMSLCNNGDSFLFTMNTFFFVYV